MLENALLHPTPAAEPDQVSEIATRLTQMLEQAQTALAASRAQEAGLAAEVDASRGGVNVGGPGTDGYIPPPETQAQILKINQDVIEELVGEIEDEHDQDEDPQLTLKADGTIEADARASIEAFEEKITRNRYFHSQKKIKCM